MCTANDFQTKVAIVEDHPLLRECLFDFITLWGYSVTILARNGKEFIDQINDRTLPEICVLDLNMPILNGFETIKILNKSWPNVKIIAISIDVMKGINDILWGADAVISKAEGILEIKKVLKELSHTNPT